MWGAMTSPSSWCSPKRRNHVKIQRGCFVVSGERCLLLCCLNARSPCRNLIQMLHVEDGNVNFQHDKHCRISQRPILITYCFVCRRGPTARCMRCWRRTGWCTPTGARQRTASRRACWRCLMTRRATSAPCSWSLAPTTQLSPPTDPPSCRYETTSTLGANSYREHMGPQSYAMPHVRQMFVRNEGQLRDREMQVFTLGADCCVTIPALNVLQLCDILQIVSCWCALWLIVCWMCSFSVGLKCQLWLHTRCWGRATLCRSVSRRWQHRPPARASPPKSSSWAPSQTRQALHTSSNTLSYRMICHLNFIQRNVEEEDEADVSLCACLSPLLA